jgi:hypothetical protein
MMGIFGIGWLASDQTRCRGRAEHVAQFPAIKAIKFVVRRAPGLDILVCNEHRLDHLRGIEIIPWAVYGYVHGLNTRPQGL